MNARLRLIPEPAASRAERYGEDWLFLEGDIAVPGQLDSPPDPSPSTLLRWNADLAGGAKFVVSPDRRVRLRAELPWSEESASPEAAVAVAAGFAQALRLVRQEGSPASSTPPPPAPEASAGQLLEAVTESGWELRPRPDGTYVADLADSHGRWQALVLPLPEAGIAIRAEVADFASASAEAREGIALLLLLAGSAVRWARPAVRTQDGREMAVFEVVLPTKPAPGAIADALRALSVACQSVGAEAAVLLEDAAARDYRQIIGPISVPNLNNQGKEETHG